MESRKIRRAFAITVIVCLTLITGYFIINAVIQKKIRQQFADLSPILVIKFSKVNTNFLSSSVSFDSLDINFIPYKNREQDKHHLYFSTVSLDGVSFLKFLFTKKLQADDLLLDKGNIQLDSFLLDKKDSAQANVLSQIKWPFKKLYVRNVELKNTDVFLHSENGQRQLAKTNMLFKGVSINKPGEQPSFDDIDLRLSGVNYQTADYKIRFIHLAVNNSKGILELDSLYVSARKENQNEVAIPSLRMTGFDVMKLLNEKTLIAKNLIIDKAKISLLKNERSIIPTLPFAVQKIEINNLQCKDLSVVYKDKATECRFRADIALNDAGIDPSFNLNKAQFGSVRGEISGFHYSGNEYQSAEINKIKFDSKKELVQVNAVNITPRIGKYELGKKLGHQVDWMQAYISRVDIIKPDFQKAASRKIICG
jgi:hypothetical protein